MHIVDSADLRVIDLHFQGTSRVIATALLLDESGPVLVDPGPASALRTLSAGLAASGVQVADIQAILLTHIHLDHAGATGRLVEANPSITVYVHERGAKHLAEPGKLLASAARIYGDNLVPLWGELKPVPSANLRALRGGENIALGLARLRVAYTPGHANHHVAYLDARRGLAFVGDTAGVRIGGLALVLPVTPPPDVDLDRWFQSLRTIGEWRAERLFLTHFGTVAEPEDHLARLEAALRGWSDQVRASLANDSTDEERAQIFAADLLTDLRRRLAEQDVRRYELAVGPADSWYGLARYCRATQVA